MTPSNACALAGLPTDGHRRPHLAGSSTPSRCTGGRTISSTRSLLPSTNEIEHGTITALRQLQLVYRLEPANEVAPPGRSGTIAFTGEVDTGLAAPGDARGPGWRSRRCTSYHLPGRVDTNGGWSQHSSGQWQVERSSRLATTCGAHRKRRSGTLRGRSQGGAPAPTAAVLLVEGSTQALNDLLQLWSITVSTSPRTWWRNWLR